jgi:hypothetical protein
LTFMSPNFVTRSGAMRLAPAGIFASYPAET